MSNFLLSGLTTVTTIHLFDGMDDVLDDIKSIFCWFHHILPDNRAIKGLVYFGATIIILRSVPHVFRHTSFFAYCEREVLYFHRSNNCKDILRFKRELLGGFKSNTTLPLFEDKKLVILELYMGGGTNLTYYPRDSLIIGVDSEESNGILLQNNILYESFNSISFLHSIVEELNCIPDKSVSCVISFHSLCFARNKIRALDEIQRVLLPGGKLIFIEHTLGRIRFSAMWLAQKNFKLSMYLLGCNFSKIEDIIESAGFSSVRYKYEQIDVSKFIGPLKSLSPHVYGYAIK